MKKITIVAGCSLLIANFASAEVTTPGVYEMHFDWGCDGTYSISKNFTLKNDGTFQSGSLKGTWKEIDRTLTWKYSNNTYYTGYHTSRSATGVAVGYNGLEGCFYMIKMSKPLTQEQMQQLDMAEPQFDNGIGEAGGEALF
ncbi:hypothetical protein [Spartinivicinus poritis]|uniref:Uncharacterized protein n=1 Tax=Spartinivicinus poritis TaxID=2994640 RepID=A0ABT5U5T2_9GAMM|nr:hypothetical protein [Spartinivicinus sp. A2-2]MDE1461721.1 hypothetical protein [Spartinivicinus sp. A2-2]